MQRGREDLVLGGPSLVCKPRVEWQLMLCMLLHYHLCKTGGPPLWTCKLHIDQHSLNHANFGLESCCQTPFGLASFHTLSAHGGFCLQVVKNKCAPPYKIAEFDIMFGSGISGLGCLLDAAEGVDIVQKKGSWYSFGDQKLGQGRDKTMAILAENTEMQRQACTPIL